MSKFCVSFLASLFLMFALVAAPASAQQTGEVTGRVMNTETAAPVSSASVEVRSGSGATLTGVLTDPQGRFRISGLQPGSYSLVVSLVGFLTASQPVAITAGSITAIGDIALEPSAVLLNPVVVSASKRQEKALDAPAHVEVVTSQAIEERPSTSLTDHLKSAPGLTFISQGLNSTNVSARGFNNIFSGALHFITDNRIASVPSLRHNSYSLVPTSSEDVDRMEVVLGPGSALYGPNTANGVVHVITRSPLEHQGNVVTLGAGERSVLTGSFRTSQLVTDNFGVKLSGRYLQGNEWEHEDPVEEEALAAALARGEVDTRIGRRDFDLQQYAFEGRADWRVAPDATLVFSSGMSNVSGLELTGIGASQIEGWTSAYYQTRFQWDRLFAQAYLNTSDAGTTYNLRDDLNIIDTSKLFVAQLQHGFDLGERQSFTYGADFFHTMPETGGTIHGVNEDDDKVTEYGAYLQSETVLHPKLDLVIAGRYDDHSELQDGVFSPRVGLVYKPNENNSLRATYNRAFSTPGALNYFLDINSGPIRGAAGQLGYGARLQGNRGGWTFRNAAGAYTFRSPFTPAALGGPGQSLAVDPSLLYQYAIGLLAQLGHIDAATAAALGQLAPLAGNLPINLLDPTNQTIRPLTDSSIPDIAALQESTNQTFEVGYKGILGGRLLLAADAWYSKIDNFISGVEIASGFLLLDPAGLNQLFTAAGLPAGVAQGLAEGIAPIPLGLISPSNMSTTPGQTDLLLTYRNFGEVDLWGTDIAATALLTDDWSLGVTGSFTSNEHFDTEGRKIWLNGPSKRGSASLGYRNEQNGWNGEFRVRYNDAFPAQSGVHIAVSCVQDNLLSQSCVESSTLLDLTLGYTLPMMQKTTLQLSATNLLDDKYRSFAGVPKIGRMTLLQIRREF